ncbi:unnamed protein product [Sphenostylis stenocarpa]|uniref:Uncharacterized protein n=1 Tax=Sphenostylis stenocarpa TaxID=92480 RepID=A0AA86V9F0_9FABA|nr:unnamed protein product [Sphenostylis stenocarpa]
MKNFVCMENGLVLSAIDSRDPPDDDSYVTNTQHRPANDVTHLRKKVIEGKLKRKKGRKKIRSQRNT